RPGSGGEERGNRPAQRWTGLASACRDHRDGKDLDPGRRRTLEDAAHGAGQVRKYCEGVLGNRDHRGNTDQGGNGKDGNGKDGNG
ncbi:hypothetical protein HO151_06490, partial [Streptomyces sp. 8P21H-1]|nr:hypothetical protein [Streptomyces sp. 8P21H-1]